MAWVTSPGYPGSYYWEGQVPEVLPPVPGAGMSSGGVLGIPVPDVLSASGLPGVGGVAVPSALAIPPAIAAALAVVGGLGLRAIITWLLSTWGGRAIVAALVAAVGKLTFSGWAMDAVKELAATMLPGQQEWLGEFPAGLGELGGRVVRTWTAGGKAVYFALIEKPTRRGTRLQPYVFSDKRSAWLPFTYRRNIVIGAKELSLASALGHKRRMGKRRVLQTIAGHHSGPRGGHYRGRKK